MNRTQLVDAVAEKANITKRAARIAVTVVLDEINTATATNAKGFKPAKAHVQPVSRTPAKKAPAKKAPPTSRSKASIGAPRETVRIKKSTISKSAAVKKAPA